MRMINGLFTHIDWPKDAFMHNRNESIKSSSRSNDVFANSKTTALHINKYANCFNLIIIKKGGKLNINKGKEWKTKWKNTEKRITLTVYIPLAQGPLRSVGAAMGAAPPISSAAGLNGLNCNICKLAGTIIIIAINNNYNKIYIKSI